MEQYDQFPCYVRKIKCKLQKSLILEKLCLPLLVLFTYSGAAERILDWVGRKYFIGDKKKFFAQIFSPKRAFPQILGGQLPTLPTRVRRPCTYSKSSNRVHVCPKKTPPNLNSHYWRLIFISDWSKMVKNPPY